MDAPEVSEAAPAPEKKRSKLLVVAIVTAALVGSAAVAGVVVGPKIATARAQTAVKKPAAEAIGETITLEPIVVDTRSEDGAIHHLKVALSLELKEGVPKEEFNKYQPRGREAAVAYLRGEAFETVAAPQRFGEVRKELGHRVIEAMGERRLERVLVTDFVAQ